MKTLKETGTPWAEQYRGNLRLTGRLSAYPVYMDTGEVAPGWTWVGEMTQEEFDNKFEWEVHQQFHTPHRPDFACAHCDELGWNN